VLLRNYMFDAHRWMAIYVDDRKRPHAGGLPSFLGHGTPDRGAAAASPPTKPSRLADG